MTVATETDSEVIAAQAYKEMEAEKAGVPINDDKKKVDDATKSTDDDSKPSLEVVGAADKKSEEIADDAKKQQQEVDAASKEKTDKDKKDKELADRYKAAGFEQPVEEEVLIAKEKEIADEKFNEEIKQYAIKHSLTIDEAKEDFAKTKAVIEKYKNDPAEIARALRSTQSAYDKMKAQEKKAQVFQPLTDEQFLAQAKQRFSDAKVIESYRNRFPEKTELMTDGAIAEEMAINALPGYKNFVAQKESEISTQANEKRDQLLTELSQDDKVFLPDVKAVIMKVPAANLVSDGEGILEDALSLARGKRYWADVKAAEARGFKRGQESAKILGAKSSADGKPAPKKSTETAGGSLTEAQKKQAFHMFPIDDGYSEEKACQMFKETYADELKKNSKFVPY